MQEQIIDFDYRLVSCDVIHFKISMFERYLLLYFYFFIAFFRYHLVPLYFPPYFKATESFQWHLNRSK